MSFRVIDIDIMLRGTVLAIVESLFPSGMPSLKDYCCEENVAASTFRRAAEWLQGLLPGLFLARRPGPQAEAPAPSRGAREEALRKLEDLRPWLQERQSPTENNSCYSAEAKQRIASTTKEIQDSGTLTAAEISSTLGIGERQIRRMRKEVEQAQGGAPQSGSRRPKNAEELSEEIQRLIHRIQETADSRVPYTGMDIKRILQKKYKQELLEHHGSETISKTTVLKYMERKESPQAKNQREHPRGNYHYPQPFQEVAVDTSYLKLFGRTFYLITVFDLGGRLNLLTRCFLRDRTESVVEVLEGYLARFPGVGVVVIDRGTPYLNEEVRSVLEAHGKFRLVCPAATPQAKAAAERHFWHLKGVIEAAILNVFPEDPAWEPERFLKLVEVAAAAFQELYHEIPQPGIDGKSPAERASSFDVLKAHAAMIELLGRSADSEPAEIYARELHQRFQFPGSEEETVKRLRQFRTSVLRRLAAELGPRMGPPAPSWMYDPLGYFAAKAAELSRKQGESFHKEQFRKEQAKEKKEAERKQREALEAEDREWKEHPERFVEGTLKLVVKSLRRGTGLSILTGHLKELLQSLRSQLGSAFHCELRRLTERIAAFTEDVALRLKAENFLSELVRGLGSQGGPEARRIDVSHKT
jgi:hypothetical protein